MFCCLAFSVSANAETILYLNFDDAAPVTAVADGTAYSAGISEVVSPTIGAATLSFRNNCGDGADIGAAPGGLSGTAQGGQVLLVDSGAANDEGLQVVAANGIAPGDVTIEAIWFTDDATGGTNTVGIQSIIGNEWPGGERAQLFLRTVGADRMNWWTDRGDSNNENVQSTGTGVNAANTWYHDVLVFDYNDGDPANSQIIAYRDGVQIGSSVYDATGIPTSVFGAGFNSERRVAVGFANSLDANLSDHRGLSGGVDAVAITTQVLSPGSFVLPGGNVVSNVSDWQLMD